MREPAVYITTNRYNGTLYTGVTSNLLQRIYQHKVGAFEGFSKQYGCVRLVYYEVCGSMIEAIEFEKYIKAGSRERSYRPPTHQAVHPSPVSHTTP